VAFFISWRQTAGGVVVAGVRTHGVAYADRESAAREAAAIGRPYVITEAETVEEASAQALVGFGLRAAPLGSDSSR
jgi:hypothetical protein